MSTDNAKQLLLGNAAVARGLYEAGCGVASSYPGTPSTEIAEHAAEYGEIYSEWAPNEKVAMEVAFGASLAGKRSFTGMKHVGLNVAADPLFTMSYTGVNAGMVIAVADDPGMHSSQNEQDSRHYAIAAKLPMLEPADSAESLAFTKYAFELSEKFDTPVIVRMCTRVSHSQSIVEVSERIEPPVKEYVKNAQKYVMLPGHAKIRHPIIEQRTRDLTALAEDAFFNRVEPGGTDVGIIASGTAYQYVKEVYGDKASVLKLGMVNPLPEKLILDFASKVERLVVVEELDPVIEDHCRKLGLSVDGKNLLPQVDEFSQNLVAEKLGVPVARGATLDETIPPRPPVMCAGCPHRGLFYTLARKKATVFGDIGCYSLAATAPLSAMDTTICMGASVSGLHGYNCAMGNTGGGNGVDSVSGSNSILECSSAMENTGAAGSNSVAVIGDSTFAHTGVNGLIDVAYNGSNSTVIILDNSITGMTGHQENPTTGFNIKGEPAGKIDLEALCKAIGIRRVRVVDPYDLKECMAAVSEEMEAPEPSVIISRRPCALLKSVKPQPPLAVDEEKCVGCESCMKIGCPAISMKTGSAAVGVNDAADGRKAGSKKAGVDATQCVGCGVCMQLCKRGALGQA